ncbi:MAG: DNA-directed RNA polymerase subunit N [Rhodoplanes sp.]
MRPIFAAALIAVAFAPSEVLAGERVGDAALGALSGAVVLGPVGAAAGAVIGYTAGPGIARSWGIGGHRKRHGRRSVRRPAKSNRTATTQKSSNRKGPWYNVIRR